MSPFWKCLKSSPKVEIHLHSEGTGSYGAYTTGDLIEGSIQIVSETYLALDTLQVTLQGKSQVEIEQVTHYSRSKSKHVFLTISKSISGPKGDHSSCLTPGKTYTFPFFFEVPKRIASSSCQHAKASPDVFDSHMQLPPTLEREGPAELDVFASNVAKITYTIRVSLFASTEGSEPSKPLACAVQPIRILPTSMEDPLREGLGSHFYCTHSERKLRAGHLGPSLGKLIAFASSSKPIEIGRTALDKINTTVTLGIHFYPEANASPPQPCSITASLGSITFYSAEPCENYPDALIGSESFAHGRGIYCKSINLSKRCIKSAPWLYQKPFICQDGLDLTEAHTFHSSYGARYEAEILVPITVPTDRHFIPTFHSCLISRVYFLDITFSYRHSQVQLLSSKASLRLPIHICG